MGKAGRKPTAKTLLDLPVAAGEKPATPEQAAEMLRKYFLEPLARTEAAFAESRRVTVWLPKSAKSRRRRKRAGAGVVARLRRGRPPYERAPITAVAEKAIEGGVDPSLSAFRDRVRSLLEVQHIPAPGDTVLEEICKQVYERAQSVKK
jgi:hypothetical protein